jgi:hypothetical protein
MPVTNTTIKFDFQVGTPPANDPIYLFRNGAFENGAVPRTGGSGNNQNSPTRIEGNWLIVSPNVNDHTRFRLDFLPGVDLTNYTRLNVTWVTEKGYNVAGTQLAQGPNVTFFRGAAGNTGTGGEFWSIPTPIPNSSWILNSQQRITDLSSFEFWRDPGMLGELYIAEISFSTNDVPTPPPLPDPILQSIAVTTPPALVLYPAGDKFSSDGLVVTASYIGKVATNVTANVILTMGDKTINDDYEFLAEDAGPQTITVSYTEGGVTRINTFDITITAGSLVVESITVDARPTKWTYEVGETFVRTGLVVTAHYEGGGSANRAYYATLTMGGTNLIGYTFQAADLGTKTVDVTYEGHTATFEIQVNDALAPLVLFENGTWASGVMASLEGGSINNNRIEVPWVLAVDDDDDDCFRLLITLSDVNITGYEKMILGFSTDVGNQNKFFVFTFEFSDDKAVSYISHGWWQAQPSPQTIVFDGTANQGQWQGWNGDFKIDGTNQILNELEIYTDTAGGEVLYITSIRFE